MQNQKQRNVVLYSFSKLFQGVVNVSHSDELITDSHVVNPHRKKSKKKKWVTGAISFSQITETRHYGENDIEHWRTKDFIFWFVSCLKKNFPNLPEYNIVYIKDGKNIKAMETALKKAGHGKKKLKDFISYTVEQQAQKILDKKESQGELLSFTTNDLLDFFNSYMQSLYLKKKGGGNTDDSENIKVTKKELESCWKQGKLISLLRNYGIPISATFVFYKIKNKDVSDEDKIKKITEVISNVFEKVSFNQDILHNIAKHSMMRSPYPDTYILLDWKEKFMSTWDKIDVQKNTWWQEDEQ